MLVLFTLNIHLSKPVFCINEPSKVSYLFSTARTRELETMVLSFDKLNAFYSNFRRHVCMRYIPLEITFR